jgi:hypothetical protein
MYTRILVPSDGSALTRSAGRSLLVYPFPDPSAVSSFVNRLEAEIPLSRMAITSGVQRKGTEIFSWVPENSMAEAVLAVADIIDVSRIAVRLPLPAYRAG